MDKAVESSMSQMIDQVEPAIAEVKRQATTAITRLTGLIRENPGKSLLIALAAGILIALVARRV